jgi:hypothetical protein
MLCKAPSRYRRRRDANARRHAAHPSAISDIVRKFKSGKPSIDALGAKPAYKHRLKAGLLDISAVNTS